MDTLLKLSQLTQLTEELEEILISHLCILFEKTHGEFDLQHSAMDVWIYLLNQETKTFENKSFFSTTR